MTTDTAVPARPPVRPAGYGVVRVGRRAGFLLHRRAALVSLGLAVLLAALSVAYLCVGESFVAPGEVVKVVLGQPSPDELVVGTLRLPRLVVGLLVGLAFGVAGALIQTVARNPLASPDIIGISQGAGALTVGAMTFGVTSYTLLPYLSVLGGVAAAALVYVFAWRGGLHATRFVLIGIGFAVALRSVTTLFLTKGDYLVAQQAQIWMTGSLNGRGWTEAAPIGWTLLVLLPAVLWAARAQRTVSMDDDTATALGVRLGRVRLGLVALGVILASVATGTAGPVDFVALLAPQIARRTTRTAQIPLLCSALLGAIVVVLGDLLARRLFSPTELPVGVLTAAVGAPYLIWLIIRGHGGRSGGTA
ncbi:MULTISPECIES: iron chelate uptake ABC transporter family permease subunit [unclassified Streptomyces]|uniref:FecCD family ABC transporter permease n=1 Tax=unclassified Streptomyces TaxID=2593676 RepID=UPI0001C1CF5A|nr:MULTISPECIES: iron chelate uptake ABC transporter family permease subunit [unclassified Streptomyces]MYR66490.1 iron chelate uptake ABC transporter family permease subunit [Streptomyces sp. SID4939]MYS04551.1 iron chelate uptake ABC transporter family permease subunit [Streptomyces sp. SID4940]MYT61874.1 iron chelate uptake ABC transporter family permease subunit [Streptomyces sp. SID8357]MYT85244.1 iron chelate uptake ABC transporter family permease subunit [Streptomyces sp. SID8360]MYW390